MSNLKKESLKLRENWQVIEQNKQTQEFQILDPLTKYFRVVQVWSSVDAWWSSGQRAGLPIRVQFSAMAKIWLQISAPSVPLAISAMMMFSWYRIKPFIAQSNFRRIELMIPEDYNHTKGDGPPLPGSATPRVRHSQGAIICGIRTFRSP